MADRIAVTKETVQQYIKDRLDRSNYHLFYGLHILPQLQFNAIMDALINGELHPEELIRLGGFTAAEADILLKEALGSWTNPAVATPTVGQDGYKYLTEDLGLGEMVRAAANATLGPAVSTILGAFIKIGGTDGHESENEAERLFQTLVLGTALQGQSLRDVLPADETEFRLLPCAGNVDQMWEWGKLIFAPLIAPDTGLLLRRLVSVGDIQAVLRSAPGLAEWLVTEPRPAYDTQLMVHRIAAERTVNGPYTLSDLNALVLACESARPNFIATGRRLSILDVRVSIAYAAALLHFPDNAELAARCIALKGALQGIYDHRDRLRRFLILVVAGCASNLLGEYPSS